MADGIGLQHRTAAGAAATTGAAAATAGVGGAAAAATGAVVAEEGMADNRLTDFQLRRTFNQCSYGSAPFVMGQREPAHDE